MNDQETCRHEYIKIYQRRLKGLDRRLVGTRAYLPVGFKIVDFKHLSEGSFCFCTKCRKRLFPKRTQREKDLARLERKAEKEAKEQAELDAYHAGLSGSEHPDAESKPVSGTDKITEISLARERELDLEKSFGFGSSDLQANKSFEIRINLNRPETMDSKEIDEEDDLDDADDFDDTENDTDSKEADDESEIDVSVDELEIESVDVEDIKAEGVKLASDDDDYDDSCDLPDEED